LCRPWKNTWETEGKFAHGSCVPVLFRGGWDGSHDDKKCQTGNV
jgi:hypothetical protein